MKLSPPLSAPDRHRDTPRSLARREKSGGSLRITVWHDLTDEQWAAVAANLSGPYAGRGRPLIDDRRSLDGILFVLKTGASWEHMPRCYGSPATAWRRLNRWSEDGTWERIWRALLGLFSDAEKQEWAEALIHGHCVPAKKGALGQFVKPTNVEE